MKKGLTPTPKTIEEARKMGRIKAAIAAPLWGLSRYALALKCNRGEVPGAHKLGRPWYVTPEGMDAMFQPAAKKISGK